MHTNHKNKESSPPLPPPISFIRAFVTAARVLTAVHVQQVQISIGTKHDHYDDNKCMQKLERLPDMGTGSAWTSKRKCLAVIACRTYMQLLLEQSCPLSRNIQHSPIPYLPVHNYKGANQLETKFNACGIAFKQL